MQLSPRYDGPPILILDVELADPSVPLLRQRQRLADGLGALDAAQWAHPSRCAGWSAQDVILHLEATNRFWAASIAAGRKGEPTRYLTGFDPVASPAQMVEAARGTSPAEVLDRFVASNGALATAIDGLDDDGWATITAEAPPGHISLHGVALHALWDSWVHERDVLLPLGLAVVEEADEIAGCLRYSAALGPAFLAAAGCDRTGAYVVEGSGPDVHLVVEVGATARVHDGDAPAAAPRLTGRSVDLLEGLSFRAPLQVDVPDADSWMFGGLAAVFDRPS